MIIETKIVYFDKKGPANTDETLQLDRAWCRCPNIKDIIVASGGHGICCEGGDNSNISARIRGHQNL